MYNQDIEDRVKKAMQELLNSVNVMGHEKEIATGMFEALAHEHRTIQQNFFRTFAQAMDKYYLFGEQYHDARNEASVEWAKKAAGIDVMFPFI